MIYYPLGFSIALPETVPEKELTFTACKGSRSVLCILQMGNRSTKILRLKLLFSTLLNWTLTFFLQSTLEYFQYSSLEYRAPRDSHRDERAPTLDTVNGIYETMEGNTLPAVKRTTWKCFFQHHIGFILKKGRKYIFIGQYSKLWSKKP